MATFPPDESPVPDDRDLHPAVLGRKRLGPLARGGLAPQRLDPERDRRQRPTGEHPVDGLDNWTGCALLPQRVSWTWTLVMIALPGLKPSFEL